MIQFILALAIALGPHAPAHATVTGRTPEQMIALFDEYVKHAKLQKDAAHPATPDWTTIGGKEFLTKTVISQLSAVEPADFNLFIFYIMDRYVNQPTEREIIFDFISSLSAAIAPDLEITRRLQSGPTAFVLEGALVYGTGLLLVGSLAWKFIFSRAGWGLEFMRHLRQRELALNNISRVFGGGFKLGTHPMTLAFTAGAAAGYIKDYVIPGGSTRRFDPSAILMVIQAQVACHLSYRGLELQNRYEAIQDDPEQVAKEQQDLAGKIKDIQTQSQELVTQWPRLESLDVKDRLFIKTLNAFPKATDWQKFRQSLSEAETSQDGRCRQMSLIHLNRELAKTAELLGPVPTPPVIPDVP